MYFFRFLQIFWTKMVAWLKCPVPNHIKHAVARTGYINPALEDLTEEAINQIERDVQNLPEGKRYPSIPWSDILLAYYPVLEDGHQANWPSATAARRPREVTERLSPVAPPIVPGETLIKYVPPTPNGKNEFGSVISNSQCKKCRSWFSNSLFRSNRFYIPSGNKSFVCYQGITSTGSGHRGWLWRSLRETMI